MFEEENIYLVSQQILVESLLHISHGILTGRPEVCSWQVYVLLRETDSVF